MNEITISQDGYESLLRDEFFADAMKSLLRNKRKTGHGLYSDEIKTICDLFGIEADDE